MELMLMILPPRPRVIMRRPASTEHRKVPVSEIVMTRCPSDRTYLCSWPVPWAITVETGSHAPPSRAIRRPTSFSRRYDTVDAILRLFTAYGARHRVGDTGA